VARKQPNVSEQQIEHRTREARPRARANALTRAEARALSRSTPLTMTEFKAHRLLAEQRIAPLHVVLNGPGDNGLVGDRLDGRAGDPRDGIAVDSPET
jgi:hypothetical protein